MKKLLLCVIFALFLLPLAVMGQCGTENLTAQDAEGTTFNSVKVGPHCWLKPNLSIKLDSSKIYKSEMYPDTDANLATFGRLYDWYTAMNVQPGQSPVVGEHGFVQGICPEGWHLPTEAETRELMNYDAKTLHATEHWFVPGTNTTGFTMLPGGYYNAMKKYGENLGGDCYMWSAQSLDPSNPTVIWSDCHCEYFLVNRGSAVNGMSVRCVYKIYQGEVTTDSVKEITDQSATLYGTIAFNGYDEEYERGFVYGTDRDNLDQWAVESSTASEETAPFNKEITGLTVATTYYYQAYIVNDFDTVWGEIKDFTTLQIQVTTDSASNITHYTATLHGNLIYVNSSVNAGFKYGTSEDALTSISNVSILSATGQYWADLVGLTEGTTYFFKAFAAHGTDTVYGEVKDFTTKYIEVETSAASNIKSTSATLNGELTILKGYENANVGFKYGTSESALTSIVAKDAAMTATGLFSCDIDGLTVNTKYYFKAFAANGTDTVYGEVKDFTTTGSSTFTCGTSKVKDVDLNEYNTVQIGNQCWMKENLRTTTKRNGVGNIYTENPKAGYNAETYGYYYDWEAVMQNESGDKVQGICPTGWHVPSDAEWTQLTDYVKSKAEYKCGEDADNIANALSAATGWNTPVGCGAGDNSTTLNKTGFSAVPAGDCFGGNFYDFGTGAYFWSATRSDDNVASRRLFGYSSIVYSSYGNKALGFSVRCLKDKEVPAAMSVTTDSANTVTNNTATLHGNVTNMGGKDNVYVGFKYGTSESTLTSIAADESAMYATGRFSYTITGLTANTQYYFKAFAANGTDTVYGEVKDFKTMSFSCLGTPKANERGITDAIDSVVDVDGNAYNTVQIGNQCWMAENLRTTKYAGGTGIELGSSTSTETAYRYNPGNSSNNVSTYGYLYNWPAVMNTSFSSEANPSGVQGVCPTGWHVPSDAEWDTLTTYVNSVADYKCNNVNNNIANALSAATGWQNPSECCAGSEKQTLNKTGFSAVPAGFYNDVDYFCFGSSAYFWSATQYNSDFAYYRYLDCSNASVSRESIVKYYGYSVRCLRDEEAPAAMSVTTDSANTVTNNTATLHGTVTNMGGKDNVYAGFKYGTSESTLTSIVVKDAAMTATGLFSCDITGLTANTQYYFKAFVANSTDTVYGEVKDFTTNFICGIDSIKDADNNWYHTVNMAGQCWMKENLRTTTKRKGVGNIYTGNTQTGYNAETYGYYYNWAAVMQNESGDKVRGICPEGWHVPSDAEWNTLTTDVNVVADYRCGEINNAIANALSSSTGWTSPKECGAGHNSTTLNKTGFSAVPAGSCVRGDFNFFGEDAYFWSATQSDDGYAWCRSLGSGYIYVFRRYGDKDTGFSVRCLKD